MSAEELGESVHRNTLEVLAEEAAQQPPAEQPPVEDNSMGLDQSSPEADPMESEQLSDACHSMEIDSSAHVQPSDERVPMDLDEARPSAVPQRAVFVFRKERGTKRRFDCVVSSPPRKKRRIDERGIQRRKDSSVASSRPRTRQRLERRGTKRRQDSRVSTRPTKRTRLDRQQVLVDELDSGGDTIDWSGNDEQPRYGEEVEQVHSPVPPPLRRSARLAAKPPVPPPLRRSARLAAKPRVSYVGMC